MLNLPRCRCLSNCMDLAVYRDSDSPGIAGDTGSCFVTIQNCVAVDCRLSLCERAPFRGAKGDGAADSHAETQIYFRIIALAGCRFRIVDRGTHERTSRERTRP